jgi:predicted RNase H-like HicB family nuclease
MIDDATAEKLADAAVARPYSRVLIPDEGGGYTAHVLEFPGCITEGDTAEETLRRLDDTMHSWVAAAVRRGQGIPEPHIENRYSGQIRVRMPRDLHRRAAELAERDRVSLNTFIACAVAGRVGMLEERG